MENASSHFFKGASQQPLQQGYCTMQQSCFSDYYMQNEDCTIGFVKAALQMLWCSLGMFWQIKQKDEHLISLSTGAA